MRGASHKCATKAAWKTRSLLRVRRFCSTYGVIPLSKAHALSYIEYITHGLHFASTSVLDKIDKVQTMFLRQIRVSDAVDFDSCNLAPLRVRRDISMLGVIHRAANSAGPPQLSKLISASIADTCSRSPWQITAQLSGGRKGRRAGPSNYVAFGSRNDLCVLIVSRAVRREQRRKEISK